MKKFKDSVDDFFKWVKGTELVELDDIDVSEDPVRPELTLGFRITNGRKIFGLKYDNVYIIKGDQKISNHVLEHCKDLARVYSFDLQFVSCEQFCNGLTIKEESFFV